MIDKMSNYILDNIIIKDDKVSEAQREVLNFGVTRILEDIPKYLFIILVCYILKILPELGIVFLVTVLYKSFVGGAHARTNLQCFIYSTMFFVGPILISKYFLVPNAVLYVFYFVVFIFSIYVILKIAPADTEEVPIINKKIRRNLRIIAMISLIAIYTISFTFLKNIQYINMIIITLFVINILATKPLYRLLKCKYSYESDEFKKYFAIS